MNVLVRNMACSTDGSTAATGEGHSGLVHSATIQEAQKHCDAAEYDGDQERDTVVPKSRDRIIRVFLTHSRV